MNRDEEALADYILSPEYRAHLGLALLEAVMRTKKLAAMGLGHDTLKKEEQHTKALTLFVKAFPGIEL